MTVKIVSPGLWPWKNQYVQLSTAQTNAPATAMSMPATIRFPRDVIFIVRRCGLLAAAAPCFGISMAHPPHKKKAHA